jgi:hypothetical protein
VVIVASLVIGLIRRRRGARPLMPGRKEWPWLMLLF